MDTFNGHRFAMIQFQEVGAYWEPTRAKKRQFMQDTRVRCADHVNVFYRYYGYSYPLLTVSRVASALMLSVEGVAIVGA